MLKDISSLSFKRHATANLANIDFKKVDLREVTYVTIFVKSMKVHGSE